MNRAFAFLSRIAIRHPWKVVAAWVLVMVAAAPFAAQFEDTLSGAGWDVAGSDSQHARQLIERELPQTFPQNLVAVYHSDDLTVDDDAYAAAVDASLSRVQAVELLRSHGFTARRLKDGFPEWREDGFPVEAVGAG